jgi:transposase
MTRGGHNKRFTDQKEREEIARLYQEEGMSANSIGQKLNATHSVIIRVLREMKIPIDSNKKRQIYSGQQVSEAKRLYQEEGLGSTDIARELNLRSGDAVLYLLKQAGVEREAQGGIGDRRARYTRLDPEELRRLYWEEGLDVPQIAKKLEETRQVVSKAMKRARIELRPRGGKKLFDDEIINQIIDSYVNQGMTQSEVAEKFGCSHKTIGNILLREGKQARKFMGGWDTIADALHSDDPIMEEECSFYVFKTIFGKRYRKFGISKDITDRAALSKSDGLYKELEHVWLLQTRRHAILLEKSVLRDPSLSCNVPENILSLAGGYEVRARDDWSNLVEWIESLVDSLSEAGKDHLLQWAWTNIPALKEHEVKR